MAHIEPAVLDQIMNAASAKEVLAHPPEQPTVADLKKRYGTEDGDKSDFLEFTSGVTATISVAEKRGHLVH